MTLILPDSRLEAPDLYTPNKKPVVPLKPNRDNPLGKILGFAFINELRDVVNNLKLNETNDCFRRLEGVFDKTQRHITIDTAGQTSPFGVEATEDFTIHTYCRFNNAGGGFYALGVRDSLAIGKAVGKFFFYINGTSVFSNGNYQPDKDIMITAVRESGIMKLYLDGVLQNQTALKAEACGAGAFYIGALYNGGGYFTGNIYNILKFNRALNQEEVLSLNEDNYQVVLPL